MIQLNVVKKKGEKKRNFVEEDFNYSPAANSISVKMCIYYPVTFKDYILICD